ncbi:MAG: DUF2891 domain-containing protein [Saprospiraceae bacterium]|nr:DUF2891 domain-containing protein [Saprospiraceae bacterium]
MKYTAIWGLIIIVIACSQKEKNIKNTVDNTIKKDSILMISKESQLNLEQANHLSKLPLNCIDTEYPNKLNQTLGKEEDLNPPSVLHPAFYGCFDWHSAVHGQWSLVTLLKQFPNLENAELIREKLIQRISKENILQEVTYFQEPLNKSYERTYGWAWLLKLAEELHNWDDSLARKLENNLYPLTNLIANKYIEFLPKLIYPIRIGTHTNTGFGLTFAYDYAIAVGNDKLKNAIVERSLAFFESDTNAPLAWEPGGYDFLSPCFEEIDIMRRVLPANKFAAWLKKFLPELSSLDFKLEPGIVSDREDGHLVHLDGLNFSRAWCLYGIVQTLPKYHHLKKIALNHINYSLPTIADANYEGEHWLASFAIYALNCKKGKDGE